MELKSHYNDYIENLSMMQTIYALFTEGISYLVHVSAIYLIYSKTIYAIKCRYHLSYIGYAIFAYYCHLMKLNF